MTTIAAISTPSGSGAIAIIRLSGSEALSITEKIFKKNTVEARDLASPIGIAKSSKEMRVPTSIQNYPPWHVHFGRIVDGDENIDEVLLTIFKAPNSYTGEDMVEISCHGSVYIQQSILQLLIR